MSKSNTSAPKTAMTKAAASRIQSSSAKSTGGTTPKTSFSARAQAAADKGTRK
jgi:hypothetical protein